MDNKDSLPIIFKNYKEMIVEYCKHCSKYKYKDKYISKDEFKKLFSKFISSNIVFNYKPDEFFVDDSILDEHKKNETIKINAVTKIDNQEIEEEALIDIKFIRGICDICSKIKGGYYEGIFQLRNKENEDYEKVLNEIEENVDKKINAAITKRIDQKNGIDLFFTDKKLLQSIGSLMHKKYGGEFVKSVRLYSQDRQSSKKVYRVNVLLRLSLYNSGDIIKLDNNYYKIISFSSDKMTILSLDNQKSKITKSNDNSIEIVAKKKDYIETTITKKKPHIEILHPITFESVPLSNNVDTVGSKINIIIVDNKIYSV
jgi:nonsense-mediated mRNA decay protein 3